MKQKKTTLVFVIGLLLSTFTTYAAISQPSRKIVLDGQHLSIRDVIDVARHHKSVVIADQSLSTVTRSHQLLLSAAQNDMAIYGLTRGVGLNKDKKIFDGKQKLSPELIKLSEAYNRRSIYAHSAGVGESTNIELVRATLLIRLNTLLLGNAGVQPHVVQLYAAFLNQDINPIIPARGSMGQADITILSHIGLAMMGEGEVIYQGKRIPAVRALAQAHLKPLRPCAKDALSIISSNAYATAISVLAIDDLQKLLNVSYVIFALNMEGYNANIEVFLPMVHQIRAYPYQINASRRILETFSGSYLWLPSANRALQEPLSFKTAAQNFSIVTEALDEVMEKINIQMNSSDDNPAVVLTDDSQWLSKISRQYVVNDGVNRGAILPTANYSPITWVVSLEKLNNALSHFSHATTQQMIHLSDPNFSHLPRFLSPNEHTLAFSAIQKSFVSLDTENRSMANPVSADSTPVAGDIEDMSTNSALVARRLSQIICNLHYQLGMQLMHGAQAIDLRLRDKPNLTLAKSTRRLFKAYRRVVPMITEDRPLTPDINKSALFVQNYR